MLGEFIDREAELATLRAAFRQAEDGKPRLVSVEGASGMGKTALIKTFRTTMPGAHSFLVAADESERVLQYGVVGHLLRQLAAYRPICDAATDTSLQDLDPFKVGAMVLEYVGEIQADGTVVLIVEDAHWADRDSLQAIAFAFRRLLADQVLVLLSVRENKLSQLPAGLLRLIDEERGQRITLKGLPPREVRNFATSCGWQLSTAAATRLHDHTHGNPLYIKTLLSELTPSALPPDWERPLPAPRRFHEIVLKRLRHCSRPAQQVIEAASVLGVRCKLARTLRLSEMLDRLPVLDEAVGSGLLVLSQGVGEPELLFEHPLTRASIYHSLPLSMRSALHRRAAQVSAEEAVSLQHEVAAAHGHDEELASRVEQFARGQVRRASWTIAGDAFLAAARLYSDPQKQERCTFDAIDCRLLAGDLTTAKQLASRLGDHPPSAHYDYAAARVLMVSGAVARAGDLYRKAWRQLTDVEEPDPGLAARIAGWYAAALEMQGRAREATDWAQQALRCQPSEFSRSSFALLILFLSQGSVEQARQALRTLSPLPGEPLAIGPEWCEQLLGRGVLRMVTDDLAAARDDLTRVVELARQQGTPFLLTLALVYLTDTEYRLGEWDAAVAHGEQATSTAEDSDQVFIAGWAHGIAAFPHFGRGAVEQAEHHIRAAEQIAEADRLSVSHAHATIARARFELMVGRPALAAQLLEAVLELGAEPIEEPGVQPWRLLYAEALCEQGRIEAAAVALDRAEDRIRERGLRSLLVTVGRIRGALEVRIGNLQKGVRFFEEALSGSHDVTAPFELARLELAYGSVLRRLGRRRAAKEALESARERFLRLRAQPFISRCETELAGTGLKPRRRTVDKSNLLTSQELAVSRLVAQGLSNRETAAQLVVSPKTVEYHLVNVFGKLGVRSRSQLVQHFIATNRYNKPE